MGACSYSLTAHARGSPVGAQPVGAVHGGARGLAGGEEAGEDLVRVRVRVTVTVTVRVS